VGSVRLRSIRSSRDRRDWFPCSELDISVYRWCADKGQDGVGRLLGGNWRTGHGKSRCWAAIAFSIYLLR